MLIYLPANAATLVQDLKRVLKKAGLEGRDTVFLFSDTQIIQEGFLEDLNNILNAGQHHCPDSPFQLLQLLVTVQDKAGNQLH